MRYIVKRKKNSTPTANLSKILDDEKRAKLDSPESCLIFKKNCEISKEKIKNKSRTNKDYPNVASAPQDIPAVLLI